MKQAVARPGPEAAPAAGAAGARHAGASPRLAAQRRAMEAAFGAQRVVQRTIEVDTVDYDPEADDRRHGIIAHAAVRTHLMQALNADPFPAGPVRNHRQNVLDAVFGQDWSEPDVPTLADGIRDAVLAGYQQRGIGLTHGQQQTLHTVIQQALVANIQADPVHPMNAGERNAFDQLAALAGAGASRRKGAPSVLPQNQVPGPVMGQVNARLQEIRNERALWNRAALKAEPQLIFPGFLSADVTGRQRAQHYQGNHSNVAGWLPVQPAPADPVAALLPRVRDAASGKLKGILDGPDPWTVLQNNGQPHGRRGEFARVAKAQIDAGLTDGDVVTAAMAALCAGVSGYVEFNMAHDISRLVYDPVAGQIYVTAHYKWRQGYNPFFHITGIAI
jgi:hypothetical protein